MKLRILMQRVPKLAWILCVAQLVLLVVLLLSLSRLMNVGASESLRANAQQQRLVIDAKTGLVSGAVSLKPSPRKSSTANATPDYDITGFDVVDDKENIIEKPIDDTNTTETGVPLASKDTFEDISETTDVKADKTTPPSIATLPDSNSEAPTEVPTEEMPEKTPEATENPTAGGTSILNVPPVIMPTIARTNMSLVMAPAPEITDNSNGKMLPKRGENKATPAKLYARGFAWPKDEAKIKPTIALLVMGLGLDAASMKAALELPSEITFSISPYTEKGDSWVSSARNAGHEVWMDLPAQTREFPADDPGPYGIFSPMAASDITERLQSAMSEFSGFVGMSLPIDQTVLTDATLMNPILAELEGRGLYLVVPTTATALKSIANLEKYRRSILIADSVIDSTPSEAFMRTKLQKLEAIATEKGHAFGVITASPFSIKMLQSWSAGLKAKHIALAPVSALTRAPKSKE